MQFVLNVVADFIIKENIVYVCIHFIMHILASV